MKMSLTNTNYRTTNSARSLGTQSSLFQTSNEEEEKTKSQTSQKLLFTLAAI